MKLQCINCRYCTTKTNLNKVWGPEHLCLHPELISIITGEPQACEELRKEEGECGVAGKYWKEKVDIIRKEK